MKVFLTTAFFCCMSLAALAQDNVNVKEMVGFGCYYEGKSSETVQRMEKLLKRKKYDQVSQLLTSKNTGEKYLAVISLARLSELGLYQLNENEKQLLKAAQSSHESVSVCSGCTYFDQVQMKKILSQDNFIGSRYWLDDVILKN